MTVAPSTQPDVTEAGSRLLLGKPVAAAITDEVRAGVARYIERNDVIPALAVMTIGPTPAAERYTETLRKQSAAVGLAFERVSLDADSDEATVRERIMDLNYTSKIAGILVQMPLPAHLP